jgi:hypothetical protein
VPFWLAHAFLSKNPHNNKTLSYILPDTGGKFKQNPSCPDKAAEVPVS